MNSSVSYEGDQGHTLVVLLPGGPIQLGGAEVAAVSSDQAAWQLGKSELTSSAQVDVSCAGNSSGEIR